MDQIKTEMKEGAADRFAFSIDPERPLCEGRPAWTWLGGVSGVDVSIAFSKVDEELRGEAMEAEKQFMDALLEIICRHRYLKLQKKLETNIEHISEEMTEKERTREYNMPLYEMYALSEYVDFSKLPDEETPSEAQEAAGEANAISKEEFEELMQERMKKRHRVAFATNSDSDKEQPKGANKGGELVSALQGIKEVLERMEGTLSPAIHSINQEKLDQMIQDYEKRKARKTYAGGTGDGAPGPNIQIPCPPKRLET